MPVVDNSRDLWRRFFLGAAVFVFFGILWILRGGLDAASPLHTFRGQTMGTTYSVQVAQALTAEARAALDGRIAQRLSELDRDIFSTWVEDSELSRFNDAEAPYHYSASSDMLAVSLMAQDAYSLTRGAFDPTIAPLVDLWGFGPTFRSADIPADEDIERARAALDFEALQVDEEAGTLGKAQPLRLDYSAIAKGYGADAIAALLDNEGLENYLVEVGGELVVRGEKYPGREWLVGIEAPQEGPRVALQAIGNAGQRVAIAASGDYRNYYEVDGRRFSHEIDPTTGRPIDHSLVSVTVLHASATMADALATAFMVMGPEDSLALAGRAELPLYLILRADDGYEYRHSPAFSAYLRKLDNQ